MESKIKPTPCTDCDKASTCTGKCERFDNWFKVSWREVVKPFRELYKWKKGQKMKIIVEEGAFMPTRGHATDAGLDLRTPLSFEIKAGGSAIIDTGVHIEIHEGLVGMLKSKSGLNVRHGITSEGVIDAGYTGSIVAKLYNHGDKDVHFEAGDKITQLVIIPVYIPSELTVVDSFEETERGANGFGSTGR